MISCLLCTPRPFWKGLYSARKEFASLGSKFFPFKVDPISEGNCLIELCVLKMYPFPDGSKYFP